MSNTPILTRPDITTALTKGASALFLDMGYAVLPEFILASGRRADIAGLNRQGKVLIAEIKSCKADFDIDTKWPAYIDYCDQFYFVVDEMFPTAILPQDFGLIVADGFSAAILREPTGCVPLGAARRKAITLRFGRQAAHRLKQ